MVKCAVIFNNIFAAVRRKITDLLHRNTGVSIKINRINDMIAVKTPAQIFLVGDGRTAIKISEFPLSPSRADIIFRLRSALARGW